MALLNAYLSVNTQLTIIKIALLCQPHDLLYFKHPFQCHNICQSKDKNDDMKDIVMVVVQRQRRTVILYKIHSNLAVCIKTHKQRTRW